MRNSSIKQKQPKPRPCACGCGRMCYPLHGSAIVPKLHPNCKFKAASKPSASKYTGKAKAMRKKSNKAKARDNADKWFSRYIRIKYSELIANDGTVLCRCFINKKTLRAAKAMDNGHCFSREFKATRFEEDNCRPQNRSSNRFSGEADHYKFRDNLEAEIGLERFNRIDALRRTTGEDNEAYYKEQSDKYRKLTNELIKQKNCNKWW